MTNKIETYKLLAECIRSEQVSARQIQEHFEEDPKFKSWYIKNYCKKYKTN